MDVNKVDVREFYANKSVLVTGGTGFLGKVLVEKLLRCTDPRTIYLLMRTKKGRSSEERLEEFLKSEVFHQLRDEKPMTLKKIKLVSGDILASELGLTAKSRTELQNEVEIIFHSAACVRFDQRLEEAVEMNTAGTERVLQLAESLQRLRVFVHVSTAYSHCYLPELHERVYPAQHDPRQIIEAIQKLDKSTIDYLTPKLIIPHPNTYGYTKCLTEQLVASYQDRFRVVIARPSIVTPAWNEPLPGWVDNMNGPVGLLTACGKGVMRSMKADGSMSSDFVPVDMVSNACILLAAYTAIDSPAEVRVCNVCDSGMNPITWERISDIGNEKYKEAPFSLALWYPWAILTTSGALHWIMTLLFQLLPSFLIDLLLQLFGKPAFMMRVQRRIADGIKMLEYYTTRQWHFHNSSFCELPRRLSRRDAQIFYTDIRLLSWQNYIRDCILTARQYACKESPDTLPAARRLFNKLFWLDTTCKVALGWVLARQLLSLAQCFVIPLVH